MKRKWLKLRAHLTNVQSQRVGWVRGCINLRSDDITMSKWHKKNSITDSTLKLIYLYSTQFSQFSIKLYPQFFSSCHFVWWYSSVVGRQHRDSFNILNSQFKLWPTTFHYLSGLNILWYFISFYLLFQPLTAHSFSWKIELMLR